MKIYRLYYSHDCDLPPELDSVMGERPVIFLISKSPSERIEVSTIMDGKYFEILFCKEEFAVLISSRIGSYSEDSGKNKGTFANKFMSKYYSGHALLGFRGIDISKFELSILDENDTTDSIKLKMIFFTHRDEKMIKCSKCGEEKKFGFHRITENNAECVMIVVNGDDIRLPNDEKDAIISLNDVETSERKEEVLHCASPKCSAPKIEVTEDELNMVRNKVNAAILSMTIRGAERNDTTETN